MLRAGLRGARLVTRRMTRRMSVKAEQESTTESKTVLDTKAQDFEAIKKETYQKVGKMADRITSIIGPAFNVWCACSVAGFWVAVLK